MVEGSAELAWQLICICISPTETRESAGVAMRRQGQICLSLTVLHRRGIEPASQAESLDGSFLGAALSAMTQTVVPESHGTQDIERIGGFRQRA